MADITDFDELQMFFNEPYEVNSKITITPPTVGTVVKWGERRYYSMVHVLTCIPSDMKSELFDMGIDYEEISDYEFFCMMARGLSSDETSILFGDTLDFQKFILCTKKENGEVCLYDPENDIIIDKLAYIKISEYLRKYHFIKPKVEKAATKTVKRILIDLDRQDKKKNAGKPYRSNLKKMVSSMMRYPGFKYKSSELKECGLYEFLDTVYGSNIYVSSTALLKGCYSGMIDTTKINKKELDWMREIDL